MPTLVPLEDAAAAVNESSKALAGYLAAFLGFTAYVVVAAGSTTNRMIVMESALPLPLVGVSVPLRAFYSVIPVMYVIMHLHLLLQIRMIRQQVRVFEESLPPVAESAACRDHVAILFPFLLTRAMINRQLTGQSPGLFVLVFFALVKLAPILTLLLIQLCFLPYHSLSVTCLHRVILLLDVWLIYTLLKVEIAPTVQPEVSGPTKPIQRVIAWVRYAAATARSRFAANWQWFANQQGYVIALPIILLAYASVCLLTIPDEFLDRSSISLTRLQKLNSPFKALFSAIDRRRVIVDENDNIGADLPPASTLADILGSKDKAGAWLRTQPGLDLTGRDFRYADFRGTRFIKVVTSINPYTRHTPDRSDRPAAFEGANFDFAEFIDGSLNFANFDFANMEDCKLRGATLDDASLVGANLKKAQLQGASLYNANASLADFESAGLQGADLHLANLSCTNLSGALMIGACVRATNLSGADISGTRFDLADLDVPELFGVRDPAGSYCLRQAHVTLLYWNPPTESELRQLDLQLQRTVLWSSDSGMSPAALADEAASVAELRAKALTRVDPPDDMWVAITGAIVKKGDLPAIPRLLATTTSSSASQISDSHKLPSPKTATKNLPGPQDPFRTFVRFATSYDFEKNLALRVDELRQYAFQDPWIAWGIYYWNSDNLVLVPADQQIAPWNLSSNVVSAVANHDISLPPERELFPADFAWAIEYMASKAAKAKIVAAANTGPQARASINHALTQPQPIRVSAAAPKVIPRAVAGR